MRSLFSHKVQVAELRGSETSATRDREVILVITYLRETLMQPTQEKINQTGKYNYLLFRPRGYEELEQQWPLILFLHGSGERGDNLE